MHGNFWNFCSSLFIECLSDLGGSLISFKLQAAPRSSGMIVLLSWTSRVPDDRSIWSRTLFTKSKRPTCSNVDIAKRNDTFPCAQVFSSLMLRKAYSKRDGFLIFERRWRHESEAFYYIPTIEIDEGRFLDFKIGATFWSCAYNMTATITWSRRWQRMTRSSWPW